MRLADLLQLGVVIVLAGYGLLVWIAFRRTRDPASAMVLLLAAYWSLVGALYFIAAKRIAGGNRPTPTWRTGSSQ